MLVIKKQQGCPMMIMMTRMSRMKTPMTSPTTSPNFRYEGHAFTDTT